MKACPIPVVVVLIFVVWALPVSARTQAALRCPTAPDILQIVLDAYGKPVLDANKCPIYSHGPLGQQQVARCPRSPSASQILLDSNGVSITDAWSCSVFGN